MENCNIWAEFTHKLVEDNVLISALCHNLCRRLQHLTCPDIGDWNHTRVHKRRCGLCIPEGRVSSIPYAGNKILFKPEGLLDDFNVAIVLAVPDLLDGAEADVFVRAAVASDQVVIKGLESGAARGEKGARGGCPVGRVVAGGREGGAEVRGQ